MLDHFAQVICYLPQLRVKVLSHEVHVLTLAVSLVLRRRGGRCRCLQGIYELLQLLLLTLDEVKLSLQPVLVSLDVVQCVAQLLHLVMALLEQLVPGVDMGCLTHEPLLLFPQL